MVSRSRTPAHAALFLSAASVTGGVKAKGSLATAGRLRDMPCVPRGQVLRCTPLSSHQLLTTKLLAHLPSYSLASETLKPREGLGTAKQMQTGVADRKPRML